MKKMDKEMFGGPGLAHFEHILMVDEMHGMNRVYARVTLEPGCAVGYHVHQGDGEDYFILSGQATIDDNHERELILNPGQHFFTPSGKGHSITNHGNEDLVFMALIIYDQQQK
ncbi:cupin domain-containing protein [Floccifex sp.]|uniref:cupin domain-containing protein n=1 Tax=Floccifex sp. TaxID=2815810 RepID=UPI003F08F9FA